MDYPRHSFNSITALADHLRTVKQAPGAGYASDKRARMTWDHSTNYGAAHEMAAEGGNWDEGAQQLKQTFIDAQALAHNDTPPTEDMDVTGYRLDIEEFLRGTPECWYTEDESDDRPDRVITMGVAISRGSSITDQEAMNRGAAVLSAIDSLESQGIRVELIAYWAQTETYSNLPACDFRVKIKGAEDHWSPTSVAFALCHPAFSRRLMFRLAESEEGCNSLTTGGYGMGQSDAQMGSPFDINLPRHEGKWATSIEAAMDKINRTIKTQLEENQ